jgi:DNA-directed RNA polymerase subunit beta'
MSNGAVKDAGRMVRAKDLKPEANGLFDPKVTGGLEGTKWSHMKLPEPFPNPLFEKAIKSLSGLDTKGFSALVGGTKALDPKTGKLIDDLDGGLTGGKAIGHMLKKIDVTKELEIAKEQLSNPNLKANRLDQANKKVKYLTALQKAGLNANDAYMMKNVPILPPSMRPISQFPNGDLNVDDLNHMYKGISLSARQLKGMSPLVPEESKAEVRAEIYDGLKSLTGLGGTANREFRGVIDVLSGKRPDRDTGAKVGSPKEGYFQSKLVQRKQDLSMRSTIIPEPSLGLDEVALPRTAAMELYKPFIVKELRSLTGVSPLKAQQMIKDREPMVNKALERVVENRPILLKRDPALHKYSIQAFKPRITGGKAVKIHPLVTSGFNADFDGDTMGAFVPVSTEAVDEAKKMYPSRNLFSPATGDLMYKPTLESQLGLYGISKVGDKTSKSFSNIKEVESAQRKGDIGLNDQIKVNGISATTGRFMVAGALPAEMRKDFISSKAPLDKKGQSQLLTQVAKEHRNDYGEVVNKLKDLGNQWSTETAFSIGLDDIKPEKAARQAILTKADKAVSTSGTKGAQRDAKSIREYDKATQEMHKKLSKLPEKDNALMIMHNSGIKPTMDTLRQIKMAPMLFANAKGATIPTPARKSFAEGLDLSDYWTSMSGARKGIIQKVQSVQEPGYISKQVMNSVMNNSVLDDDCGTKSGINLSVDEKDILDRYLASDVKAGKSTFKRGTLITPDIRNSLRNNKIRKVPVRTPLRCQHGPGLCKKCYGLDEDGKEPEVGLNVGVIAGQALGERATQLSMKAFHSGGTASSKEGLVDDFQRVKDLLLFPKILPGSATLSTVNGSVSRVQKDPAGGHNVFVRSGQEEVRHYIPQSRGAPMMGDKMLRKGVRVKKGMAISTGPVNPHEMLPLAGVEPVQGYLSGELHKIYGDKGIRRRNTEVVVKALTNLTQIEDPGDRGSFIRGDFAPTSLVANMNRQTKGGKPILHSPVLKGVNVLPLDMQEDWMARMNHQNIKATVVDAAQQGWTTKTQGRHPIPPVVLGTGLGRSKPGEY